MYLDGSLSLNSFKHFLRFCIMNINVSYPFIYFTWFAYYLLTQTSITDSSILLPSGLLIILEHIDHHLCGSKTQYVRLYSKNTLTHEHIIQNVSSAETQH